MVNILTIDISNELEKYKNEDKLETMFKLQKELANNYGVSTVDIRSKSGQRIIKDLMYCHTEELFEASNCLKNREWVKTEVEVDAVHFYEELIDSWLFYIELMIVCGLTPKKLFELYLRKYAVNKFRQNSRY